MADQRQCDYWATTRDGPQRFWRDYRCPHPAKYRVTYAKTGAPPWEGEYACGRHVRPALMDNGDSVWKPWVVERLGRTA